jgi:hypothetical protein
MAKNNDKQNHGLDPLDIGAGAAVDIGLLFGLSSEIASHQKQDVLGQGIDAGAKARKSYLESHRSPPVDSQEYKAWLSNMNATVDSARRSFIEKVQRLSKPLTQPIEVFRNASVAQKAGMIGALLGAGILVAAFVRKIRKDWSHDSTVSPDSDFERHLRQAPEFLTEPIKSTKFLENQTSKASGMTFKDRLAESREIESAQSKRR